MAKRQLVALLLVALVCSQHCLVMCRDSILPIAAHPHLPDYIAVPHITVTQGSLSGTAAGASGLPLDHSCAVAALKPVQHSLRLITLFYTSMLVAKSGPGGAAIAAMMLSNPKYAAPTSGAAWTAHILAVGNAANQAIKNCQVPASSKGGGGGIVVAAGMTGSLGISLPHASVTLAGPNGRHLLELPTWAKVVGVGLGIGLTVCLVAATDGLAIPLIMPFVEGAAAEALGLAAGSTAAAVAEFVTVGTAEYLIGYELPGALFTATVDFAKWLAGGQENEDTEELTKCLEFGSSATFFFSDAKKAVLDGKAPRSVTELGDQIGSEVSTARDLYDTLTKGISLGSSNAGEEVESNKEQLQVDAFAPNAPQQADGALHRLMAAQPILNNKRRKQQPAGLQSPSTTTAAGTSAPRLTPAGTPAVTSRPGGASTPAGAKTTTGPQSSTPLTYTAGGSQYSLCPCKPPSACNAPVQGGQGVRMVGTDDCVNCDDSYPCPSGMRCVPGRPSPTQEASMTFSTCA